MSNQKPIYCNKECGTEIFFDDRQVAESGKKIPLEKATGKPHQCPNSDYQKGRSKNIANIDELNQKLDKILEGVIEINNKLMKQGTL